MFDISKITGLTCDSRSVKPGYLFAAFPGSKTDGRTYIPAAIENGASVILAPTGTAIPPQAGNRNTLILTDDNPRKKFANIAAKFYNAQPKHIVAVTGTNGKTSVVHFIRQLWEIRGYKAATIGTLTGTLTTPHAAALHAQLADLSAAGVTHLAVAASSHGLDQYRLDGLQIEAAGFTNISRDHLDYHKDMAAYAAAKTRLFTEILPTDKRAIINADDEHGTNLTSATSWSYGFAGKELNIQSITAHPQGHHVTAKIMGKDCAFDLSLVGDFQVMNVLCALGMVLADDMAGLDVYLDALPMLHGAPGRLQFVSGHPTGAAVYVDYAHTPNALEYVLKALRAHTTGRLICVFGCGGNRDKGKRPVMGRIATEYADDVIVTDDNPRDEDPALIRKDILEAATNAKDIPNRGLAIEHAVSGLDTGDVLLIAGKGHEQGQVFADHTDPFDDVNEAVRVIRELKNNEK